MKFECHLCFSSDVTLLEWLRKSNQTRWLCVYFSFPLFSTFTDCFVCLNFYTKTDLFWLIKYWLTPFLEQLWTLFKFRVCVLLSQKVWNQCNNGYYFVWINGLRSVIFLNNNIGLISSGLKFWLLIKEQFYVSVKKCLRKMNFFAY